MGICRRIVLIIGRLFYEPRYMDRLAARYIVKGILGKVFLASNIGLPWPAHPSCTIQFPENIDFDLDSLRIFQQSGCFFQAIGKIRIGKGAYIAQGVGLITANHSQDDIEMVDPPKDIVIGAHCWIGMNAVILPGVVLGDHTIVGAGAVVTKSFPEGYQVIAGNPAKVIKRLNHGNN
jgi:acetyltransferase-like isoleucine patch superfamily enzyme